MIRRATMADAEAITLVHVAAIREVCGSFYRAEQIEAWVRGKAPENYVRSMARNLFFVAEQAYDVVGFSELNPETGDIYAVYVRPDRLRTGLGSELLRALEANARDRNLRRVRLHATLNAISFYEARGYVLEAMTTFRLTPEIGLECGRMYKDV